MDDVKRMAIDNEIQLLYYYMNYKMGIVSQKIWFWSTYPCTMLYAAKEGAVQEKAAIQIKRFNRNKVCAFILCTCYPHLSYST